MRKATVGAIRDARTAGVRPARAPIRMAEAMPPAHASTGSRGPSPASSVPQLGRDWLVYRPLQLNTAWICFAAPINAPACAGGMRLPDCASTALMSAPRVEQAWAVSLAAR